MRELPLGDAVIRDQLERGHRKQLGVVQVFGGLGRAGELRPFALRRAELLQGAAAEGRSPEPPVRTGDCDVSMLRSCIRICILC